MMALAISFSVPFASSNAFLVVSVEKIVVGAQTASPMIAIAKKGPILGSVGRSRRRHHRTLSLFFFQ